MFTKLPVYDYNSDDSDVALREIPSSLSSQLLPLQSEQVDDKNHRPPRRSLSSEEPEFPSIPPKHPNFQYARKTFSSNKGNSVLVNIGLKTLDTHNSINIDSLLDCGVSGLFIDKQFIELNDITRKLPRPIPIYNIDGTLNEGGTIKEAVDLIVSHGNHKECATFWVCGLGADRVILGLPWLRLHNPVINWSTGEIALSRCPRSCGYIYTENKKEKLCKAEPIPSFVDEEEDEENLVDESDWYFPGMEINFTWFNDEDVLEPPRSYERIFFCNQENDQILEFEINQAEADHLIRKNSPVEESEFDGYPRPKSLPEFYVKKNSIISNILISSSPKPPPVPFEQLVPPHYHEFLSVFDKKASERFPLKKPWDHVIDLKDTFIEQKARPYQLSSKEQEELDKWLDENLRKGYIHPSKSPQTSPFFYVPKPDGTGLRPCQDYRYLNSHTVKNNYPLPLISELVDKLRGSKFFSKMDLRWGYNNLRIKEGDEWKAAFTTNRGSFEPTVMFFGLTNSPASFQTMMNAILKDLIDEGHVVVYMDDILVFTKDLKEHQRIVNEVLKRLKENDLFLKPQK